MKKRIKRKKFQVKKVAVKKVAVKKAQVKKSVIKKSTQKMEDLKLALISIDCIGAIEEKKEVINIYLYDEMLPSQKRQIEKLTAGYKINLIDTGKVKP